MMISGAGVRRRAGVGVVSAVVGLVALVSGGAPPQSPPFEVLSDWTFYNRAGWQALQRGKLDRAEQAFRIAIERMRPYQATESVPLARSYADLSRVLHLKGRHDEAEPLARWAVAVRETAPGANSQALCQDLELLAEESTSHGRDAEAEPIITRVIAIREKTLGPGHPDLIPAVEVLAEVYARQGKLAKAEPAYRRAPLAPRVERRPEPQAGRRTRAVGRHDPGHHGRRQYDPGGCSVGDRAGDPGAAVGDQRRHAPRVVVRVPQRRRHDRALFRRPPPRRPCRGGRRPPRPRRGDPRRRRDPRGAGQGRRGKVIREIDREGYDRW